MFFKNDECDVSVQACFNVGAMTYNLNSDTTQVLCTNLNTGRDEVVAIIEGGATSEISMELSRYLPKSKRSMLLRLARENCGLRVYLLRGDRCINPLSVDEFDVLSVIGGIKFTGPWTTTEMVHNSIGASQEISESTTITGFNLTEVSKQNFATRGGATVGPVRDISFCDTQSCGGLCDRDSDGCQVVFWVDDTGNVWYSTDQLETESLSGQVTGFTLETIRALCCVDDQVVIVGDLAGVGTLWVADQADIISGAVVVWNQISVSTIGIVTTALPLLHACQTDTQDTLWLVGANGYVAQYNPVSGIVTVITAVPNITEAFLTISIQASRIIIGGTNGIFITSDNGGRSFTTITVIDPVTEIALAVDITALDIVQDKQWSVGLTDGRILYTVDGGDDWFNHILPSGLAGGAIEDIHFHTTLVGYAATAGGDVLKTYYGVCRPWVKLPESTKTLPTVTGYRRLTVCQFDPDIVFVGGESVGNAGFILYLSSEEA
jgi:hypothetical protein